jgi:hypothetical protein
MWMDLLTVLLLLRRRVVKERKRRNQFGTKRTASGTVGDNLSREEKLKNYNSTRLEGLG